MQKTAVEAAAAATRGAKVGPARREGGRWQSGKKYKIFDGSSSAFPSLSRDLIVDRLT